MKALVSPVIRAIGTLAIRRAFPDSVPLSGASREPPGAGWGPDSGVSARPGTWRGPRRCSATRCFPTRSRSRPGRSGLAVRRVSRSALACGAAAHRQRRQGGERDSNGEVSTHSLSRAGDGGGRSTTGPYDRWTRSGSGGASNS